MYDITDAPVHRINIRVVVPPSASAVLPLQAIERVIQDRGLILLGINQRREDERAPSEPSVLP